MRNSLEEYFTVSVACSFNAEQNEMFKNRLLVVDPTHNKYSSALIFAIFASWRSSF